MAKLTVWIRQSEGERLPTLRHDVKWEDRDTPVIQNFMKKLIAALEGGLEDAK